MYPGQQQPGTLAVLTTGAAVGALVLGVGGRLATAGLALVGGNAPNLSLRGAIEALLVGAVMGAIGAALLFALRNVGALSRSGRVLLGGGLLFVVSLPVGGLGGWLSFDLSSAQVTTFAVVALVFLAYAWCADAALSRLDGGGTAASTR